MAVGGLGEVWDGSSWRMVPGIVWPDQFLVSVSCTSPADCVGVGWSQAMQPIAEKWDGSRWTVTKAPSPGKHGDDLKAVSCTGPAFCLMVGTPPALGPLFGGSFADQWSGNRWHMQPLASVPGQALPDGVSCPLPTRCMVVGEDLVSGSARPLTEEWTSSGWAQLPGLAEAAVELRDGQGEAIRQVVGGHRSRDLVCLAGKSPALAISGLVRPLVPAASDGWDSAHPRAIQTAAATHAWQYALGRHSNWRLVGMTGCSRQFLQHRRQRRPDNRAESRSATARSPRSLHTAIGFVVGSDGFLDDVRLARRARLAETKQRPAIFGPAQRPDLGIRELMHPEIWTEPSAGLEIRDEDHDFPQEHDGLRGGELVPLTPEGCQTRRSASGISE
jgi:hypothetical protein